MDLRGLTRPRGKGPQTDVEAVTRRVTEAVKGVVDVKAVPQGVAVYAETMWAAIACEASAGAAPRRKASSASRLGQTESWP